VTATHKEPVVKNATLILAMLVSITATATPVAEQKKRNAIDDAATAAAADIKDCGKKFTVVFDWKAYDAIDWTGLKKDKQQQYGFERSNLKHLGEGLDKLCADKDYKAALVKINTITYRPSNDSKIKVRATISGGSMVLENYSFGSTRQVDDYENAAKAAL
jgi:hypothetical protein